MEEEFLLGVRERKHLFFFKKRYIYMHNKENGIACYGIQYRFTKTMLGKHQYSVVENIQLITVQS